MNSEEAMDQATKKKVAASLRSAAAKLLARAKSPEQAAAAVELPANMHAHSLSVKTSQGNMGLVNFLHWNVRNKLPYEDAFRILDTFLTRAFRKGYEEGYKAGLADGASEEKFQR